MRKKIEIVSAASHRMININKARDEKQNRFT